MDTLTFYLISRLAVFIFIFFISRLSFYSFRKNKYSSFIPLLSYIWLLIIFYNYELLFPELNAIGDMVIFCGSMLFPVLLLVTEAIRFIFFSQKIHTWENSNWLQVILLSFIPVLSIMSFVYYIEYGFLDIEPLGLIGLILIDKIILLIMERFYMQTTIKVIAATCLLYFGSYYIRGQLIILVTDCLIGYVLLQTKHERELKNR